MAIQFSTQLPPLRFTFWHIWSRFRMDCNEAMCDAFERLVDRLTNVEQKLAAVEQKLSASKGADKLREQREAEVRGPRRGEQRGSPSPSHHLRPVCIICAQVLPGEDSIHIFRRPIVSGHALDRAWVRAARGEPFKLAQNRFVTRIPRAFCARVWLDTDKPPPAADRVYPMNPYPREWLRDDVGAMDAAAGAATLKAFVAQRRAEFGRFDVKVFVVSQDVASRLEYPSRVMVDVDVEPHQVAWWWDQLLAQALDAASALGVATGPSAVIELSESESDSCDAFVWHHEAFMIRS